jgi:aarF domain-containing kinase
MAKDKEKVMPVSPWARTSRILGMGMRLAASEAKDKIFRPKDKANEPKSEGSVAKLRLRQVQQFVDTLSQLKGGAMKMGQLLSLELSDILPPEICEILSQLHADASPMPFRQVDRILLKAWGQERYEKVGRITQVPIAAASIGQVHKAILEDRELAIKIQYPGVSRSLDSDIGMLKKLLSTMFTLAGKKIPLDDLADEIRKTLKSEADYKLEAQSLQEFAKLLEGDSRFQLPQVLSDYSTRNILTMTFMQGIPVRKWLQQKPKKAEILWLTECLIELVLAEFFTFGLVQTDPNYGNFLINQADGGQLQLILLDFGSIRRYPKSFRKLIRHILSLIVDKTDQDLLLEECIKAKLIDPRESPQTMNLFLAMLENIGCIFRNENQPFHFNNPTYLQTMRESAWNFMQTVQYSAPAKQLIFLNRKLGGIFHILKEANGSCDLNFYWQKIMEKDI